MIIMVPSTGGTKLSLLVILGLLALSAVLLSVGGASFFAASDHGNSDPPSDLNFIYSPSASALSLIPEDPKDTKPLNEQLERSERISNVVYKRFRDGSTEDDLLERGANDADQVKQSRSYFPIQPGEIARRLNVWRHFLSSFECPHYFLRVNTCAALRLVRSADGPPPPPVVVEEKVFRLDGTLEEHTLLLADGTKHVVKYGLDGVVMVGDKLFQARGCCDEPAVKFEFRWREDNQHSLQYSNILHDDLSRTIKEFDEQERILKVSFWARDNLQDGVTVRAFYPGSLKLRLDSHSTFTRTEATYYREDSTAWYRLILTSSTTDIEYLDATGTKTLLKQSFWRKAKTEPGAAGYSYKLYQVFFFDDNSQPTRTATVDFDDPTSVHYEERFNVTIDGITYPEADYFYGTDGNLDKVRYVFDKTGTPSDRVEVHKPEEKIRAYVPPDTLAIRVTLDDDLPVPPAPDYRY